MTLVASVISLSSYECKTLDRPFKPTANGKAMQIDLNEEDSLMLIQHWTEQALSGLMTAMVTKKLPETEEKEKKIHEQCTKNATNVVQHAKCVIRLLENNSTNTIFIPTKKQENESVIAAKSTYQTKKIRTIRKKKHNRKKLTKQERHSKNKESKWVGSFEIRRKRSMNIPMFGSISPKDEERSTFSAGPIRKASSYSLHMTPDQAPLGSVAKTLTKAVRALKKKPEKLSKDWTTIINEVQEAAKKIKAKKIIRKMFTKRIASFQDNSNTTTVNERRPLAMKDLDDLDEADPHALLKEARRAESALSNEEKLMRKPIKLLREAVKLGMIATGANVSKFADSTLKLISPRLLSLIADDDEEDEVQLLSPSLFALHKDGKGIERATSLVDGFGLTRTRDQVEWLNFIMEAAGVSDAVEMLHETKIKKAVNSIMNEEQLRSPSGQPLYFTKENVTEMFGEKETVKIDTFEKLQSTYTPEQLKEQQTKGYSFMTPHQLDIAYGKNSPYHSQERLDTLKSIPKEEMHDHIVNNVRALAEMESFKIRKKDVIGAPVFFVPLVFQSVLLSGPVILSPLVFSPSILTPAIFGPVILGPWVFIPVILSPRVFSPLIVNPLIFSPIVLSPLLGHPLILAPGVFNPIVLSPLVLSPFILSPMVFAPIILSPLVLNPLILNPMVGAPLVLSPFVLSPLILSPQALFALVMSPYVLSPLIQSPLFVADVVLSPSVLS